MKKNIDPYQMDQNWLYILAYKYMANHEDTEDIVQEVLIRLWEHGPLNDIRDVRAWTSQVTRNACLDALRRRKSYRLVVSTQDCETAVQNAPAIEVNLPQYLRSALNQLENPYRILVILRDVERLSYKIICKHLKMP